MNTTLTERLETLMSQRASLISEAKRTVDAKSRADRLMMANLIRKQAERAWDRLEACKGE